MTTRTQWFLKVFIIVLFVFGMAFGLYSFLNEDNSSSDESPIIDQQEELQKTTTPTTQSVDITPESYSGLPDQDKANLRQLVEYIRLYGTPNVTPSDCSILSLGAVHYAISSYWDKDYIRDSEVWKTPEKDNLWDSNMKKDVMTPGAWMIAYLSMDKSVKRSGSLLRWAAPPSTLIPPDVPQDDPIAQAANAAWKEMLNQKYSHFSFVKVTAQDNRLQLHFKVIIDNHPQKIVASVPIEGTYNSFTLGQVTLKSE